MIGEQSSLSVFISKTKLCKSFALKWEQNVPALGKIRSKQKLRRRRTRTASFSTTVTPSYLPPSKRSSKASKIILISKSAYVPLLTKNVTRMQAVEGLTRTSSITRLMVLVVSPESRARQLLAIPQQRPRWGANGPSFSQMQPCSPHYRARQRKICVRWRRSFRRRTLACFGT